MTALPSDSTLDLVLIGNLAFNEDRTPFGQRVSCGGSAYYCAKGASVVSPGRVGVLADVGVDFDLTLLRQIGVNLEGIRIHEQGQTSHFIVTQHSDGSRTFEPIWGIATDVSLGPFPTFYYQATHFHLATMPPHRQLSWIELLRSNCPHAKISADVYESYVRSHTTESAKVVAAVDLAFMNKEEATLLDLLDEQYPSKPRIIKLGPGGAYYSHHNIRVFEPAPPTTTVIDTNGAGEILAGVFLSLSLWGLTIPDALKFAVQLASASVTEFGIDHSGIQSAIESIRQQLLSTWQHS